ncbi:MAG: AAA family ATPase [Elusimicrobia bacterium]|nr:AAA family ATPase [Elusimicrobiota bacterium]
MPKRIEKLALAGFRGASNSVEIPFDPSKPITMIFGENGTGKSSIIDAIDFVCNKEYGSIAERCVTKPREYIVALKSAAKDLRVTLQHNGSSWTGALDGAAPSISGAGTPPRARILRRGQIEKVINAQAAERYKMLQDFIVPPKIEAAESALRDCVKSLKGDLDHAVRSKAQAEEQLNGFWTAAGSSGKDCFSWAGERAKGNEADLTAVGSEAKSLQASMDKAQTAVDSWMVAFKEDSDAAGKQAKAQGALDAAESAQESDLVELLTAAQRYLPKATKADECPLCERPGISFEALVKRIAERLAAMKRMVLIKQELETARKSAQRAAAVLAHSRSNVVATARELAKTLEKSKLPEVAALKLDWTQYPTMRSAGEPEISDAVLKEAQKLQLSAKPCYAGVKARQESAAREASQLGLIKRALASVDENTKKAEGLESRSKRGEAIRLIVEKLRKDFVDGILSDISDDVGDLCEKIHPGEGIKIRLYLNPKTRGSLESDGEFEGVKGVPPQAYYSESHLDTLGVCIFLALTKKFGGKDLIVVLDDVVTSVDAPHMGRFLDMLLDQAEHFGEIIVATHYRPWLERVRHARGPSAQVQIVHLSHWTLAHGIRPGVAKLAIQDLRDSMKTAPLDRQAVASKAGVFLESLLDQLALIYECRVPRRPEPEYTLGELLDCFNKKLRAALKCEVLVAGKVAKEIALKPILDGISGTEWIRNQVGCHWNTAGADVPDKDVLAFADKTIQLAEALICAACGSLPTKRKAGAYLQCRCTGDEGLHLVPSESPEK